jgi:hypothetical protein
MLTVNKYLLLVSGCLQVASPKVVVEWVVKEQNKENKLRSMGLRANYTERATAACRRSYSQLLWIEVCRVVSAADPLRP